MTSITELYKIYLDSKGISTDSRNPLPGSVFFALKGDQFNGNAFADQAIEKGCTYAVIDEPAYLKNEKFLLVESVLKTLQQLALFHRKNLTIPFIGLTGSNGKTTTKELIAAVLSKKFKTISTIGNLNNHIGVPKTILSVKEHEIAIVEMGANHPGEIKMLCEIALPDYGLITNIGKAHLEGFGSFEGVIKTKKELYDFLSENNGTAFVNYSNSLLKEISRKLSLNTIIYGEDPQSLCNGKALTHDLVLKSDITWKGSFSQGRTEITTSLAGLYNLENVLAAIAVGLFFGVEMKDIKDAIENYSPSNNRSQILHKGSNTIIMDAYNANPSSMINALLNLAESSHPGKTAILGDMLEMGEYASQEHQSILDFLGQHPEINAFLVGEAFMKANFKNAFPSFADVKDLCKFLAANKINESLILLKGSRAIKLEDALENL
jgi:UDP-N-acetylmuramoyl-tripeptide--D-alanyl-D-alanine ligase